MSGKLEPKVLPIEIWTWSLDEDAAAFGARETDLSRAELDRAGRFLDCDLRRRFVAGRLGLRARLGFYLDINPGAVVFEENAFGKPLLAQRRDLSFSLSHSGPQALLALSQTHKVGADLEWVRPLNYLDLAQRYFCASECAAIEALAPGDRLAAFFQTWTLKEAVVKASGEGLSMPLTSFEVSISHSPPALRATGADDGPRGGWRLHTLTLARGYVGALAVSGFAGEIELIHRT